MAPLRSQHTTDQMQCHLQIKIYILINLRAKIYSNHRLNVFLFQIFKAHSIVYTLSYDHLNRDTARKILLAATKIFLNTF